MLKMAQTNRINFLCLIKHRGQANIGSMDKADYLKKLKERKKESRVYRKFQLIGLEIANLLNDPEHKSLYIKLAKQYDPEILLVLAKDVSQRKKIENKGGYFMKILQSKKLQINEKSKNSNHK